VSALLDAYDAERARLRMLPAVPPRTPLLALLGLFLARLVVALPRLRTLALSVGGFGCLVAAAWAVAIPAGLAAAGLSLLALEYLSGEDGRRR
jgi:hydrogenase/urease accessory protein HupE